MDDAKKVLHQQVFNYLEAEILDGHYKTNDTLNEVQIAKELEVSRTPVREAIMQLESIGLVSSAGGKGFVVSGISEKDLDDIYTIRIKIEGLAAGLSAKNITQDESSALEKIVDLQEFFLMKNKTEELWKLDTDFHKIIYESSRSKTLRFMLSTLHNYAKHARDISFSRKERAAASIDEHRRILNAIQSGNSETAEQEMINHIKNAKENVLKEFKA